MVRNTTTTGEVIANTAVALAATSIGNKTREIAEQVYVAALIKDLPLPHHKRQSVLPGPGASLLDKFQLLQHVDRPGRLAFFNGVIDRLLSGSSETPFLLAVLTRAGYALSHDERRGLLQELISKKGSVVVAKSWVALARSATSFSEAQQIIRDCGRDRLMAKRSRELHGYVAAIELLGALRKVPLPDPPSKYVSNPQALQRNQERIIEAYKAAKTVLKAEGSWAKSTATHASLRSNLTHSLQTFVARCKGEMTPRERNEAVRVEHAKLAFQLKYGLSFSEDIPTGSPSRWTVEAFHTVLSSLQKIGEYQIVIAQGLKGFKRVGDLGEDVAKYEDGGLIYLSDAALDSKSKSARRARWGRTPQDLIIHEVAHALSLEGLERVRNKVPSLTESIGLQEMLKPDHFPSVFLRYGRWNSVPWGYKVDLANDVVHLREQSGREISVTLDVPVIIDGESRVYQYDDEYKLLFWYDSKKGEFPLRGYGRQDPAENMAELYSSYFGDRVGVLGLIQHAPHLFWYMESLYHRYERDSGVQNSLRARLAENETRSGAVRALERETKEQGIFRMLTDSEQVAVLSALGVLADTSSEDAESRDIRSKLFNRVVKSPTRRKAVAQALQPVLAEYKPAVLLGRALLEAGAHLGVVSIRGTTDRDAEAQQPIYDLLFKCLGHKLDEKRVYFLNDVNRSRRLGGKTYHEKLAALVTEQLAGVSPRASDSVKTLPTSYDKVIVYTAIPATIEFLRTYAARLNIRNSLRVVNVGDLKSDQIVPTLLGATDASRRTEPNTLHFFTLEETLLQLSAQFRIVMRDSYTVLKKLSVEKFLTKEKPQRWLTEVAEGSDIPKSVLTFDTSDFTSRRALQVQIDTGISNNRMFKNGK